MGGPGAVRGTFWSWGDGDFYIGLGGLGQLQLQCGCLKSFVSSNICMIAIFHFLAKCPFGVTRKLPAYTVCDFFVIIVPLLTTIWGNGLETWPMASGAVWANTIWVRLALHKKIREFWRFFRLRTNLLELSFARFFRKLTLADLYNLLFASAGNTTTREAPLMQANGRRICRPL